MALARKNVTVDLFRDKFCLIGSPFRVAEIRMPRARRHAFARQPFVRAKIEYQAVRLFQPVRAATP